MKKVLKNPGIVLVCTFFTLLITTSITFFLANILFPTQVVLGTISINQGWAIFLSSTMLSLVATLALPFVNQVEENRGRVWSSMEMMGIFFVINVVALWLVSRASDIFGLGIASWMVVLVLAAVLDMFQGLAMMQLEKMRTK